MKALQDAHKEYTLDLLENRTKVEQLTKSIKEQQDAVRDMEIDLRNTILDAIKDREALNERMLQGTIDVENEIMDVIKARYEKERDQILETANAKKDALEEEKDLLDEQLEARKKAAEQEDKQLKLKQLQAKLDRISADPTRKKEELELRKEIADLRDEMAWDLAEEEVDAQKKSIDQQITSLEDYIQYVEDYYQDLFDHPQKLIEEMKSIISKTDAEILEFLKANNEEYANATEAAQQNMINSWNEMLRDMHGTIEDYWDEVEQIIAGGDDAIIEFLKQNSADYKEAGKLQAEAYVDQWKQQLEDLRKAHKEVTEEINSTKYDPVKSYTGTTSSSGGSGGGGKNSDVHGYMVTGTSPTGHQAIKLFSVDEYGSVSEALHAAQALCRQAIDMYNESGPNGFNGNWKVTKYAQGGMANFTGPAWLDGTTQAPERILSPYQTELFEDMIATLHSIKVNASVMPKITFDPSESAGNHFEFGDIVIQVDKLDSDADYHDVAQQVMEEIMESIGRGASVGGIRITK